MDAKLIEVLSAAGDLYALHEPDLLIEALNPYLTDDPDDPRRRATEWEQVRAVEHLLNLIEFSSGSAAAKTIREKIRFRYEIHEASNTPVVWELDEGKWLLYADMVSLQALNELQRLNPPLDQALTTADAESQYGLAEGTAKKAVQRGQVPGQKRGNRWFILLSDAEAEWGSNKHRKPVIDSYYALQDVLSDFERGRVEQQQVASAYQEYAQACKTAGEPAYPLEALVSDDLEDVPQGYPETVDR